MSESEKKPADVRVYLATRHREWWHNLPRFERSKILARALDLYREQEEKSTQRGDERGEIKK